MVSRFGLWRRLFWGTYRWRRSALTAIATVTVVALSISHAGSSRAQDADGDIANGTAKATGTVVRISPAVGNLELAMTSGVSVAEVTNQLAQSQSKVLDLGLIGTSLTAEQCGEESRIKPEDLPQPLRVDNREGDARATRDETGTEGSPVGVGRLIVEALTKPSGSATAETSDLEIPGVLSLSGLRSNAATEVFPGKGREARAFTEASLAIAGVKLSGLRWDAVHRTGAKEVVDGSFTVGSVAGSPLIDDTEDLAELEEGLNSVLAATATGLRVEFPVVQHLKEPTDLIRVTPLRVIFEDSELSATVLGPVLNGSREQREAAFDTLVEIYCRSGSLLFVGDAFINIMAGSGSMALEIGGVEALSGEFIAGDLITIPDIPPISAGDTGSVETPAAPAANLPAPSAPTVTGGGGDTGGDNGGTELGSAPAADLGPVERVCRSVHPFEWPSCSSGAAPLAGVLGLVATGAVFALDYRRNRLTTEAVPA